MPCPLLQGHPLCTPTAPQCLRSSRGEGKHHFCCARSWGLGHGGHVHCQGLAMARGWCGAAVGVVDVHGGGTSPPYMCACVHVRAWGEPANYTCTCVHVRAWGGPAHLTRRVNRGAKQRRVDEGPKGEYCLLLVQKFLSVFTWMCGCAVGTGFWGLLLRGCSRQAGDEGGGGDGDRGIWCSVEIVLWVQVGGWVGCCRRNFCMLQKAELQRSWLARTQCLQARVPGSGVAHLH